MRLTRPQKRKPALGLILGLGWGRDWASELARNLRVGTCSTEAIERLRIEMGRRFVSDFSVSISRNSSSSAAVAADPPADPPTTPVPRGSVNGIRRSRNCPLSNQFRFLAGFFDSVMPLLSIAKCHKPRAISRHMDLKIQTNFTLLVTGPWKE